MDEIYVSTDIEADGPIPGPHSMLSMGSAAYKDGKLIATFEANFETLTGASGHPDTMEWWSKHPEAWAAHRQNLRSPEDAMKEYVRWVEELPGKPVFVGYPAGFDFMFVYWYLVKFVGRSPFSFSALDVKSYAAGMLAKPYRECTKRNFPKKWFQGFKARHTHKALEDAIEQGEMFMNILAENRNG